MKRTHGEDEGASSTAQPAQASPGPRARRSRRSTKEELEASREELQSINEELNSTNGQLLERIAELTALNDDLANFMRATQVATVFLDTGMRLKRFTDAAAALLDLRSSDVGRAAHSAFLGCFGVDISDDVATVVRTLFPVERDLETRHGHGYTMRVRPYRTQDDQVSGVVVTLLDVDRLKRAQRGLIAAKEHAESIIETTRSALVVLDTDLCIRSTNARFHGLTGVSEKQAVGRPFVEVVRLPLGHHELVRMLERVVADHTPREDVMIEAVRAGGEVRTLLLNAAPLRTPEGEHAVLLALDDVTELLGHRRRLEEANARLTVEAREDRRTAEQQGQQLRALVSDMALIEERERKRVAQLLHDDLQQLLLAARLNVERLQDDAPAIGASPALANVHEMIEQAISIARSFAAGLYPPVLYKEGLVAAVAWLGRQHERMTGTAVTVEADGAIGPMARGQRVILFQAINELLINAAKHAQAEHVMVRLSEGSGEVLRVTVADDGVGFEPAALEVTASGSGLGLFSNRERIEALGGKMTVASEPGVGTQVTLEMPRWAESAKD